MWLPVPTSGWESESKEDRLLTRLIVTWTKAVMVNYCCVHFNEGQLHRSLQQSRWYTDELINPLFWSLLAKMPELSRYPVNDSDQSSIRFDMGAHSFKGSGSAHEPFPGGFVLHPTHMQMSFYSLFSFLVKKWHSDGLRMLLQSFKGHYMLCIFPRLIVVSIATVNLI